MSRRTRVLLGLLALGLLVVMSVDALRQRGNRETLMPTLPAESFTFQPPETQRGLDRTPLTYQAEFVAHLADTLRPSLVLATPADGLPTAGVVLERGLAREGRPQGGASIVVAATSGSDRWTVQTLGGRVVRATVRGRDLLHGVLLLEPAEPLDIRGLPLASRPASDVGPFLAIEPGEEGTSTRVIPAPGAAARLRTRLVRDDVPSGSTIVNLDGAMVAFIGAGVDAPQPLDLDLLREIFDALREGRAHPHPWIGADLQTIHAGLRPVLPDGQLVVVHVAAGSPAGEAGLEAGDVLGGIEIGGATLRSAEAVQSALAPETTITCLRVAPTEGEVEIAVADLQVPPAFLEEDTGVAPADAPGVAVRVLPGSAAATAGLRTGDVVEAIDQQPVTSAAAITRALAGDETRLLTVRREDTRRFILVAGPPGGAPANETERTR